MNKKNIFISCKESRIESNRSFYGCFTIGPFNSDESLTIANALRRTLLSECLGLGIVSVIIDNVTHEYSTIPGMRESVLDLILNLKEVIFKKVNNPYILYKKKGTIYNQIGDSYFKPVSGYLKVKGPGIIRAKDLKLPPFLECVDPEQYIATLAEDGFLCMKFIIMEGTGYLLHKKKKDLFPFFDSKLNESEKQESSEQKKSFSFIDNDLVKNRSRFLKELKDLKSSKDVHGLGFALPRSGGWTSPRHVVQMQSNKGSMSTSNHKEDTKLLFEEKTSHEMFRKQKFQNYVSSTSNINFLSKTKGENSFLKIPLNLDTIFNPITKVSYIIEDFDNKIVNDLNQKVNFTDDISALIESNSFLKKNLPFLTHEMTLNQGDISKFVDSYSPSDIDKFSNFLHPLSLLKQNSFNNIIIEIWTNGSVHPRDALYFAFYKLSSAFLNMQKTQSYNVIYRNESALLLSAQKLINNN